MIRLWKPLSIVNYPRLKSWACDEFAYKSHIEDEWGYETINRDAERMHEACGLSLEKMRDFGVSPNDLNDIANYMQDTYEL